MAKKKKTKYPLKTEAYTHDDSTRPNIPTAEMQAVMEGSGEYKVGDLRYTRRNPDLDPQLVWRGKDAQNEEDLVVPTPPLFIQEKIHPKALIEDLRRESEARKGPEAQETPDLFEFFDVEAEPGAETEFYQHDANWSNRMILGDALQVMGSLAEREGLRGKVQCIYIDPPYGIKFNSNFQWSTTSRDVKDGSKAHISREPEQVKAFRDTWRDGIHSYLSYLKDRFVVARDLLNKSGSIFLQIGEENVHLVRSVLDEVFGEENYVSQIDFNTTSGSTSEYLSNARNYILWYAKDVGSLKFRRLFIKRALDFESPGPWRFVEHNSSRIPLPKSAMEFEALSEPKRIFRLGDATSQRQGRDSGVSSAMGFEFGLMGQTFSPSGSRGWSTTQKGMVRAAKASRLAPGKTNLNLVRYFDESSVVPLTSSWNDTGGTLGAEKTYVVQSNVKVIQRCLLMASDPGDLVLDPTCGSGTTAAVAERWGRRWITIDTSRVALALARSRIMGARYPYYLGTRKI